MNFWIGLVSGWFGGMMGMGGGVLMIPLMSGLMRLPQYVCHGTSLVAVAFTGLAGAATYAYFAHVDYLAAAVLAAGAFCTVRAGARVCRTLPELNLRRAFGLFLIFVSLLLLAKPWLFNLSVPTWGWLRVSVLLAGGAVTGFLSGLMGVGGGAVMIVFMVLLAGFDQQMAQGSALLAAVPVSVLGAHAHWRLGSVEKAVLPGLIPGILVGTVAGGWIAANLAEPILQLLFAAVLIGTGIRYLKGPVAVCKEE